MEDEFVFNGAYVDYEEMTISAPKKEPQKNNLWWLWLIAGWFVLNKVL